VWWGLFIRGLFALAIGILILWRPMDSIASFAFVIAFWAIYTGIVELVQAFELRRLFNRWWLLLLSGLVSLAFGIAALYYYPNLSLAFAVIWFTWWLFLSGIMAVSVAMMQRQMGVTWGWTLALGILCFAAGVVALMNPPATLSAIMGLIAGFALASGVLLLLGAFRLSAIKDQLAHAIQAGPAPAAPKA